MFMKYGTKSLTMDDIAKELGISKKTLYVYFSDKKDLVYKIIVAHFEKEKENCEYLLALDENPIEFMLGISRMVSKWIKATTPSFIFDLQKYHHEAFEYMMKFKKEFILKNIIQNMTKGVEDGWYRSEIDIEITARFYISLSDSFVNQTIEFENISYEKIVKEMIDYHLHAISTEKGIEYIKQHKQQL